MKIAEYDKRITLPLLGTIWLSEFLIILVIAALLFAMQWFADSVTQHVVAWIAISCGAFTTYDWTRPSWGSYNIGQGLPGLITAVIMLVLMLVYVTTLF